MDSLTRSRRHFRPLLIVAVWTVPAMLSCLQAWATNRLAGRQIGLITICAGQLPAWYLWAVLTPLLFRLADEAPPTWPLPRRTLLVHVIAWSACLGLHAAVIATTAMLLDPVRHPSFWSVWRVAAISWLPSAFLLYCATIGSASWMRAIEREKTRGKAQAELNEARTRAELDALRSQLHPHFLFNALNTVVILVRAGEVAAAEHVITELGAILRELLRSGGSHEAPLADELQLLRRYLEIEQLRFGSALTIEWNISSDCLDAHVPMLLLQPLVENAIRHGIARLEGGGTIVIGASRQTDRLSVRVVNDGPAGDVAHAPSGGVGLENTRRRLEHLYGPLGRLTLGRRESRTIVEVELPFHVAKWLDGASSQPGDHGERAMIRTAGIDRRAGTIA